MLRYVIDENYITLLISNIAENFNDFKNTLELIEYCDISYCDSTCLLTQDFYNKKNSDSVTNSDVCFSHEAIYGEHSDEFRQLTLIIDKATTYNPDDYYIEDGEIISDFQLIMSHYDHISLISKENHCIETWWNFQTMYRLECCSDVRKYIRDYFINHHFDVGMFWRYSGIIFQNVYFNQGLKVESLGFDTKTIGKWLIETLSYLNDHAVNNYLQDPDKFIAVSRSCGFNLSPESSNTHKDHNKMAKRNIIINDVQLCCEWHVKFRWNKGRVHFHFGNSLSEHFNKVTQGKLIVAIFCEHLPI